MFSILIINLCGEYEYVLDFMMILPHLCYKSFSILMCVLETELPEDGVREQM